MARGLAFLHRSGVIHRDLKTENILLTANNRAKIADLGCAQSDSSIQARASMVVELNFKDFLYASPEEITHAFACSAKSDIYSLGVLLWEVLSGRSPWVGVSNWRERIRDNCHEDIPDSIQAECPETYLTLLRKCWQMDPCLRPTADQVVQVMRKAMPLRLMTGSHRCWHRR